MATNYFKKFATGKDANVYSNEELEKAPELVNGLPFGKIADSKLLGKLFQNSSTVDYAIGELVRKSLGVDANPKEPEVFASNLYNLFNNVRIDNLQEDNEKIINEIFGRIVDNMNLQKVLVQAMEEGETGNPQISNIPDREGEFGIKITQKGIMLL